MFDTFLIAASLANLLLMWEWLNALHPEFLVFNIHSVSPAGIFALFLVFLSYAAIAFFIVRLSLVPSRVASSVAAVLLLSLFLFPLLHIRNFYHLGAQYPYLFAPNQIFGNWGGYNRIKYVLLAITYLAFCWRFSGGINKILRGILLILFPFCLLTFGQLIWNHYKSPSEEKEISIVPETSLKKKTLWIVLDAFDYNYTFNHREKETTLNFPEIDRFKESFFSFSHAIAPTPMTTYSMSSYLLGKTVVSFNLLPYESATNTIYETKEKLLLKDQETLLRSVKRLGASVGVLGWHIPYCALFKIETDYCVWFSPTQWPYQSTVSDNYFSVLHHTFLKKNNLQSVRRKIFELSREKSLHLIDAGLPNFTLIHFSVPHFPGINYARNRDSLTPDQQEISDYYSNLELADQTIAEIRSRLEKRGEWENMTVIITSDHWLRYAPESYMQKYGNRMYEIPLMIKLPGKNDAAKYDKPLSTLKIGELLIGTLDGTVSKNADIFMWAEKNKASSYDELIKKTADVSEKVYHHDND